MGSTQRTMIPASASISESAPNAISATEPAMAPAPIAIAASRACHANPARSEEPRSGGEPFPAGAAVGRALGAGGGVADGELDGHLDQYATASAVLLER